MFHAILLTAIIAPAQPAAWPMDELTLANGNKLHGLLIDETKDGYRFRVVRRPVGRPTVTFTSFFPPKEVREVKKLGDADRKFLREKLAELDVTTTGERKRADELKLSPARRFDWPEPAHQYDSDRFVIISTASDEITRRAAVRLEQIFTAYERYFSVTAAGAKPTTIYLTPDERDYEKIHLRLTRSPVAAGSLPLAFFAPEADAIVCGTRLQALGEELAATRQAHAKQLAEVAKYEQKINELYKNARAELERHQKSAADERAKILTADRINDARFDEATSRLFARLYHEAFHAFAFNYAYPELTVEDVKAGRGPGALPRWLNEGLAQVFETAILDGYELRVGHADRKRLTAIQDGLAGKGGMKLMPLEHLLASAAENYHRPATMAQFADVNISYHTSWALAFHLMFEKRLIGTPAFHEYLAALNTGTAPKAAFEKLVGKELPAFEADFRDYLARLQSDGSLKK